MCELGRNSEWQRGLHFLYKQRTEWPIQQSYSGAALPGVRVHSLTISSKPQGLINNLLDINRFSNLEKLFFVTARVLKTVQLRSLKAALHQPTIADVYRARDLWILAAQQEKGKFDRSLDDRNS